MKQICTLFAALCLLVIAQNVYAQTVSSTTTPSSSPTPGFGTPDSVNASNGFTSTNTGATTFNEFAPNQTDTIMSPQYHYNSPQSSISFILNCSVSNVNTAAKVLIITSAGDTIRATSNAQNYQKASIDYFFTFDLGTVLPANTNFKIAVIMTLGGKAVAVNTFTTNAIKGAIAPASLPLPVTFTGFYAKNGSGYTSLTWNIATESNVSGYEVQRSIDGSNFSKIGFVAATNSPSYSFVDSKGGNAVYYRIKSIDVDGKYSYSIIVNVKGLESDVVMKAFPMPVQNQLTIQHSAASSNSKLEIVSADGRMIKALALVQGAQQTSIDLSSAKPGVYVVRFVNGLNIQSSKIIKQ